MPLVTSDDGVGVITLDVGNGSTIGPVSIIGFGGGFTFVDEGSAARNTTLPVVVVKLIDASSPKLLSLALKGQCINSVQVLLCQAGSNCTTATAYATYTLSRARISEARIGDDVAGPVLTEQFKITYEQIKLSTSGGAAASQGDFCFDMTANSAC
jgi:type VI protein secretion system component Hcp